MEKKVTYLAATMTVSELRIKNDLFIFDINLEIWPIGTILVNFNFD